MSTFPAISGGDGDKPRGQGFLPPGHGTPPAEEKKKGRPAHAPTDDDRSRVKMLAEVGVAEEHIARIVGVSAKTLRKHYREELATAHVAANAAVASALFRKALGDGEGSVAAAKFWLSCRAGWVQTERREHTGKDGEPLAPSADPLAGIDLKGLTDAELADLEASLGVIDGIRARHGRQEVPK